MNLTIKKDLAFQMIEESLLESLDYYSHYFYIDDSGQCCFLEDLTIKDIENVKNTIQDTISNVDKMDILMNDLRPVVINVLKNAISLYENELEWKLKNE